MPTPGTLIIVFLVSIVGHLQAFENEESTEGVVETGHFQTPEFDQAVPKISLLKRILTLQIFDEKEMLEARETEFYDDMPYRYRIVFESTAYVETTLFCIVLAYGLLHLPIWEKLYNKYINPTEECETTDTNLKQRAQEGKEGSQEMEDSEDETSSKQSGEDSS